MKGQYLAAYAAIFAITAVAGEAPLVATPYGIGPVKVGMKIAQAEKALGEMLKTDYTISGETCGSAWTEKTNRDGYSFMVQDGVITRIDVGLPTQASGRAPIVTAQGIGVGSSEAAVKIAYGDRLKIAPHPYLDDQGHYLIVDEKDHKHGIIFETDTKKVTSFRTGLYPAVDYIEGCA